MNSSTDTTTSAESKITTSKEDIATLSEYGLTAKELVDKISDVIKRAREIYKEKQEHEIFLDEKDKKKFRVRLPKYYASPRAVLVCTACQHKTSGPGFITIENIHNHAKITFHEHTLHELLEHYNFGAGDCRIDPITAKNIFA